MSRLHVYSFLRFFPPSTPRLLELWVYVFQKLHPPRLFQLPRLVIWQLLYPLHVYSNLHVYQRDESRSIMLSTKKFPWFSYSKTPLNYYFGQKY